MKYEASWRSTLIPNSGGGEMAEVETHLRGCAGCAAEALGMLQTKLANACGGTRYAPSPEFRLRMEQSMRAKRKAHGSACVPRLASPPSLQCC